jgi:F-type H+-transporting ATPase subunit b
VQLGLFLILLFIFNRLMIQPLYRLNLERMEHIRKKRGELVVVQQEIRKLAEDCEKRLKRAEQEARNVQWEVRRNAQEKASQVIASAQEEVVALRQKVREDMAQELAKAREQLSLQAEALSFDVTESIVGRRI